MRWLIFGLQLVVMLAVAILARAIMISVIGVNTNGGDITYFAYGFATLFYVLSLEEPAKSHKAGTNKRG